MENNPNENNMNQGGVNNPLNDGNMQNPSTPSQTPMTNQNMPPNDMPPNDGNMQNPSTPSQTPMTNQNMPPNDMPPQEPEDKKSFFKSNKVLIIILAVIVGGGILFIVLFSIGAFVSLDSAQDSTDDSRNISYLRSLELALIQYKSTNGSFPPVSGISDGECTNISVLESHLSDSLPPFDFSDPEFFYCVDNPQNPGAYVLGVSDIDKDNSVLISDQDGNLGNPFTIQGVNAEEKCGTTSKDTVYCLSGGKRVR